MASKNFYTSIKKYIEGDVQPLSSSGTEEPNILKKKGPPLIRQDHENEKNLSNTLASTFSYLDSAKMTNDPTEKKRSSFSKITPANTITKYFELKPSSNIVAAPVKTNSSKNESEKPNKSKGTTKATTKTATAKKTEEKKARSCGPVKTKKLNPLLEAENSLHDIEGLFPTRTNGSTTSRMRTNIKDEIIVEPPKRFTDPSSSKVVAPSVKNKPKDYEFANLNYWTNTEFPWSKRLLPIMDHFFGYRTFRSNQKAIINATLAKKDVFVCMPTGGGKSLTFQLPAIIDKGVTIVVMPLLALIYDQVTQMEQKNISVLNLSGGAGAISAREYNSLIRVYEEEKRNMDYWNYTQEMPYPKIIFITPEKIAQSETTMNFLRNLYQLNLLERVVIDEAHCVSQWGRDFRKDYLDLKKLKQEFPNTCILALTATATEEIRIDIFKQLRMKDVLYFQNSFNRKNLIFEVRPKGKEAIDDIAKFIEEFYPRKCGIIFTATIKEAELVSQTLRQKHKMKCGFYHGKMSEASRNEVQDRWMNDEINVIVATIAFGMGINKLDVRFVLHYSFSKSLSNYYQEAGRAGRDGQKAHCVIFYRYQDKGVLEFLNNHNKGSSKKMKKENNWEVTNIIKYCEDKMHCRRVMLLNYFGERYDPEECAKTCDNCKEGRITVSKDLTEEAKKIVQFLQSKPNFDFTLNQVVQVLSGKLKDKNKTVFAREPQLGLLKDLKVNEIELLMKELVFKKILSQVPKKQKPRRKKFKSYNVLCVDNKKAELLFQGKEQISLAFPTLKGTSDAEAKGQKLKEKTKNQSTLTLNKNIEIKESEPKRWDSILSRSLQQNSYMKQNSDLSITSNFLQKEPDNYGVPSFRKSLTSGDLPKVATEQLLYSKEYGYCTSDQFEDIVERLKIVRKRIFNEVKVKSGGIISNTSNLDAIIPIEGLYDLCRKLPTTLEELNPKNIRNVGAKQLHEYGPKFLDEIQHFVRVYQINKSDFVIPKDIDQEEEENKEIFDIQEHFAPEINKNFEEDSGEESGSDIEEDANQKNSKSEDYIILDDDFPDIDNNYYDTIHHEWDGGEGHNEQDKSEASLPKPTRDEEVKEENQVGIGVGDGDLDIELDGSDYDDNEMLLIEEVLKEGQNQPEKGDESKEEKDATFLFNLSQNKFKGSSLKIDRDRDDRFEFDSSSKLKQFKFT